MKEVKNSGADPPAAIKVAPATSSEISKLSAITTKAGTKYSSQMIAKKKHVSSLVFFLNFLDYEKFKATKQCFSKKLKKPCGSTLKLNFLSPCREKKFFGAFVRKRKKGGKLRKNLGQNLPKLKAREKREALGSSQKSL